MKPETLKALKGSINKWEKIVSKKGRDNGKANCPLCQEFWSPSCSGCPVETKKRVQGCQRTPYPKWESHQETVHDIYILPYKVKCETCKELATKELKFLQSLLSKPESKSKPKPKKKVKKL